MADANGNGGYDSGRLYAFERDKLQRVQELLTDSFSSVQRIMQKYSDEQYKEVIADFGQQFGQFRQAVTQVLTSQMPMNLRDPFQELASLKMERQQGYEKLNSLNDELQRLREQTTRQQTLIEELKGNKHSNRLSAFSNDQNGNGNGNDEDPPYGTPLHFDDPQDTIVQLTNELETAQMNVGVLRRNADELNNHNKRLSVEVLQLRDQVNQSYNPHLNSDNLFNNGSHADSYMQNQSEIQGLQSTIEQLKIENGSLKEETQMANAKISDLKRKLEHLGGQTKHLFRADTVTNWNPDALEELKREMNKQKLMMMTNRQMQVAAGDESQLNMESIQEAVNNENPRSSEKHLYRSGTKGDWDPNELEVLKNDLMSELQDQNRKALADQLDKQMRFPEERRSTNLIGGASDAGVLTEEEMRKRHEQMKDALLQEKKKIIMEQTDKNFALRESQENQGMLQLDDLAEAKQRLLQMNKEALKKQLMRQDEFLAPVVEPTDEQYRQLDGFLKNVLGLMNENIRERTVNELKNVFSERNGSSSNAVSSGDAARDSQPHSGMDTPRAQTSYTNNNGNTLTTSNNNNNNGNVSNSLLDEESDAEILYPTPGGPHTETPGGGGDYVTPGGDIGNTPGGPMDVSVNVNVVANEDEWQRISQDQNNQITKLTSELNQKTEQINSLEYQMGVLQSEISNLKQSNQSNNNNNNNRNANENEYGDGRRNNNNNNNSDQSEINDLKRQIRDLKDMKLQLIDSTAREINHLRNLIRDMQKRINGGQL